MSNVILKMKVRKINDSFPGDIAAVIKTALVDGDIENVPMEIKHSSAFAELQDEMKLLSTFDFIDYEIKEDLEDVVGDIVDHLNATTQETDQTEDEANKDASSDIKHKAPNYFRTRGDKNA